MASFVFTMKHLCTVLAMLAFCGHACSEGDDEHYDNVVREATDSKGVARSLLHTDDVAQALRHNEDVLQAKIDKYKSETQKIQHRAKQVQEDAHTANQEYKTAKSKLFEKWGFRDGRKLLGRSDDYETRKHYDLTAEVVHWKKARKEASNKLDKYLDERSDARSNRHIAKRGLSPPPSPPSPPSPPPPFISGTCAAPVELSTIYNLGATGGGTRGTYSSTTIAMPALSPALPTSIGCLKSLTAGSKVFVVTLQPLHYLSVRQVPREGANAYNSVHELRYGGECPGDVSVDCVDGDGTDANGNDETDATMVEWENKSNKAERVFYVQSGYGGDAYSEGAFELEWVIVPMTSAPTTNAPTNGFYYPSGVQYNVDVSTVESGQWTKCYDASYSATTTQADLDMCDGTNVLMGAINSVKPTQFVILAAADTTIALSQGNQACTSPCNLYPTENNAYWYKYSGLAVGFVDNMAGNTIDIREGADIRDVQIEVKCSYRLSWPLDTVVGNNTGKPSRVQCEIQSTSDGKADTSTTMRKVMYKSSAITYAPTAHTHAPTTDAPTTDAPTTDAPTPPPGP